MGIICGIFTVYGGDVCGVRHVLYGCVRNAIANSIRLYRLQSTYRTTLFSCTALGLARLNSKAVVYGVRYGRVDYTVTLCRRAVQRLQREGHPLL
eukprot:3336852-Prymnesium_polylepis.1